MTDTFRALCAELLRGLDENRHPEVRYPGHLRQIMASARAALADEPAVPEGREPASVVANPSDAELDLLVIAIQALTPHQPDATTHNLAAVNRGRELLRDALTRWSRPAPAPPAEGEVADEELLRAYGKARRDYCHDGPTDDWPKRAERAATIAGLRAVEAAVIARRPAPAPQVEGEVAAVEQFKRAQPVPVSEHPWERTGWCDEHGRCWRDGAVDAGWILRKPSERLSHQTVSLPAHALPLLRDGIHSECADEFSDLLKRQVAPAPVGVSDWQPIDTAPKDGTEILASDYDSVEIVSWCIGSRVPGEWTNREGEAMYPGQWQPLPNHPPLPSGEVE